MFAREPIDAATWPQIHALLAPALQVTGESAADLIDLLLANTNQLWVKREGGDPTAAAVSEIEPPETLCIRLLGGKDIASWIDEAVATIAHEAPAVASKIRVEVSPGLERVLREHGFTRARVVMQKELA